VQVAQVLLTLPYSFAQLGMVSGIIFQVFYGLLGSYTAYLISILYIEYRSRKEKENVSFKNHVIQVRYPRNLDNKQLKNLLPPFPPYTVPFLFLLTSFPSFSLQWFEVLEGLLGPYWKAIGLAFNCTFLLFGSVIQLIACARFQFPHFLIVSTFLLISMYGLIEECELIEIDMYDPKNLTCLTLCKLLSLHAVIYTI